jgi:hypothetical protein
MSRTAQIYKEKITVHYFKTLRSVNLENYELRVSSSSAVAKTIKRYEETGSHEDRHRKGRPRVASAAEDKFIRELPASEIAAQINASQHSSKTHQQFRGECVNQASWSNFCKETTTKKDTIRRHWIGPRNMSKGH